MSEKDAIWYVLGDNHPGNCVPSRNFKPVYHDAAFNEFIRHDIPKDWHRFRRLCWLMYEDTGSRI